MASFVAVFDACVLYPAPVRDLLVRLAAAGLFRGRWTDQIHEEWCRNLLKNRSDIPPERIQAVCELMDKTVADCKVEGYESLIDGLILPDADDRHVLAAAIRCSAQVIVTYNLADFPADRLEPYGIEAQHPDTFLLHLLDLAPARIAGVVKEQRAILRSPPRTAQELLREFEKHQLVGTAARLEEMADLI